MARIRTCGIVDPGWDHGIAQDEKKKKVKCNYCGKIVSGGIYRLKQHLARVSGEVTYCDKAPEEVYLRMKENLEGCRSNKKPRQSEDEGQVYLNFHSNDDEEEVNVGYRSKGKQLMVDRNLSSDRNSSVNSTPLRSLGYVDPGWEHGVAQDERKKKVKCNYCEKIVSGGINRFKQHLARIPGEVAPCKHAPEEVYLMIKENMKWHRTGRRHRRPDTGELSAFFMLTDNENEEEEKEEAALHHFGKESLINGDKRLGKDLTKVVKGMSPGVPLQAADSIYFHKMLDLVGRYGQGLVCPQSQLISGRFLQEESATVKNYLIECKASWTITGCSIMADTWRDTQEDASNLFKLLDKVVEEIGEDNVVQVITENTPSYKAAGKMLEEKRRKLFWTPCATYCFDRMLEDFLKIKCVGECMEKGQQITKFIYNQIWLLNLMKNEFTDGQELLRPSVTRCASSFATLQSLRDHKVGLKKMFLSNKWISSRFSKSGLGKDVENIILNAAFWKKVHYVLKSVDPIMQVLQKIDNGESLSMPSIYNDMYRAKLAIKYIHGDDARKYEPFWNVIDYHWSSLFYHPLCMAAYFLNPSYGYRPDFMAISDYNSAKADFGTELAISTRTELDPAAWWQQHGISCLELQRIAVRILSQTCSSFGCEHNWSIFDQIYSQRHNRLAQRRLNDLIYVHYNLRLRERQLRKSSDEISLDSVLIERLLDDWIVEAEKPALEDDEEIIYSGMKQLDAYDNDLVDYQDGTAEGRKGSLELDTLADVESLEVNPANAGAATDDDADLNFFEDDLSD
uniref:BED-type domain-containing protein n=1 Tax=Fagus sylvatica TaxID=28930 RepID=A0A2N9EIB1_FAGSY